MGIHGGKLELDSLFFTDRAGNTVDIYDIDTTKKDPRNDYYAYGYNKQVLSKEVIENSSFL